MCDQTVYFLEGETPKMIMSSVERIEFYGGVFRMSDIFGEEKRVENAVFCSMEQNRFYIKKAD